MTSKKISREEKSVAIETLRNLIWHKLCREGNPDNKVVAVNIVISPRWQNLAERILKLCGAPGCDCDGMSCIQAILPLEKFQHIFQTQPEIVDKMSEAFKSPAPRPSVWTLFLMEEEYEIRPLSPLTPSGLN